MPPASAHKTAPTNNRGVEKGRYPGGLTPLRRKFCEEFLRDLNPAAAAVRAGYSPNRAPIEAAFLLTEKMVAEEIHRLMVERSKRTNMSLDRVIEELARVAFADIRKVVQWASNVVGLVEDPDTGTMKMVSHNEVTLVNSADLPDDVAAAVSEVSISPQGTLRVKLHSKLDALKQLGMHLGAVDRQEVRVLHEGTIQHQHLLAVIPPDELARQMSERGLPLQVLEE